MSTERRSAIILLALVIVAGVAAALWWLNTHEKTITEYRSAPSLEARKNPYLAASLLLTEHGIDTEVSEGLNRFQSLPSTSDVIIGERLGFRLPAQRIDDLLEWVSRAAT